ncbi:AT-rich interactive domain-containing protein 5B [Gadus macrocephalus]|uniref:AT-rich interactive domain-containing protein 5B n=1 Tax=Gadus macrocephalus TaxID=80720 RepID=UPI0028CB6031|nr:AT-rich interactive domain-containing protein 5B [Gadus macrocephalus]
MEPDSLKWVGSSCGLHGPYIFYKAFKCHSLDGKPRILSLGDFFLVRCKPGDPICIAELQLLWEERTSKQLLSSSKLYFLPEDTPKGRSASHGEHEVIAVSEKVIVRLDDLVKWTVPDAAGWVRGQHAQPLKAAALRELGRNGQREALHRYRESTLTSGLSFRDIQRERAQLGQEEDGSKVLVLSYPQYCRYRSVLARLRDQPSSSGLLVDHTVLALGGIAALGGDTRVLYCRDTFEHPVLLQNESICDEFAPNLKGRPRKKKLSVSQRRDSQSQGQGSMPGSTQGSAPVASQEPCSPSSKKNPAKLKPSSKAAGSDSRISSAARPKVNVQARRSSGEERERGKEKDREKEKEKEERREKKAEKKKQEAEAEVEEEEENSAEEQAFLVALYKYMKERDTPIERIPFLGFKQINLWTMFQAAQKLGGYELITVRRQWKHVYDELGGNPSSTSAATCTRRHYERLLLPYERNLKGQSDTPLPLVKAKKQEGSQDKAAAARAKGSGAKKSKGSHNPKQGREKREKEDETEKCKEKLQDYDESEESSELAAGARQEEGHLKEDPAVMEEEELHFILKKEESLAAADPRPAPSFKESGECRAIRAGIDAPPRRLSSPPPAILHEKLPSELRLEPGTVTVLNPPPYMAHRWDHPNKAAVRAGLPEPAARGRDGGAEGHGGRVGKVLPMFKQPAADRQSGDASGPDSLPEKRDYGVPRSEVHLSPPQLTAYCSAGQGVMSPLAKKKLLSQVCDTNPFSYTPPSVPLPPPALPLPLPPPSFPTSERDRERRAGAGGEAGGVRPGDVTHAPRVSDVPPEMATVFRPSVIQHAQSAKPLHPAAGGDQAERNPLGELSGPYACRTNHHLQPQVSPPWQPYLPQPPAQNGAEKPGEKLLHGGPPAPSHNPGYVADCYSSPHLHSLYRQTENCLSHDRMAGQKRGHYVRDGEGREGFVCSGVGLECEGLAFRSHYGDRTQTHGDGRHTDDQPRDFTIAKPLSQRLSSFSKPPPFCSLQYPIMHQGGLDSHPKACRVPPMTVSSPKPQGGSPDPSPPCFPGGGGKASPDAPHTSPCRPPSKRSLGEAENEGAPDRKVRVVTPMHPAGPLRRGDPEDLKPAEPAHAVHLNTHLPEGHPATAYPSPLYPGMYVSARPQDGLHHQQQQQQHHPHHHHHHHHPGLQYLKSQTAVSPLVPPMAFHSMLFHRQLLATGPSPHHFYRHPGGAALYGDLLHHLYPLSTLPPPQLSSVHPSTRL